MLVIEDNILVLEFWKDFLAKIPSVLKKSKVCTCPYTYCKMELFL